MVDELEITIEQHNLGGPAIVFRVPLPSNRTEMTKDEQDEWMMKTARLFIYRILRPRVLHWLSRLPNLTPQQVMQEKSRNIFTEIKQIMNKFMAQIEASPEAVSYVDSNFCSCLIEEPDLKVLSKRLLPFFFRYYAFFISYRALITSNQKEMLKNYLPVELTGAKYSTEEGMNIYHGYRALIGIMMKFGANLFRVITGSVQMAYTQLCRASFRQIIKCTGNLIINQLAAVTEILHQWLVGFPADESSSFDPDEIKALAEPTVYTMSIDLLTDRIYDLCVVEYPESFWTILLLRICMKKTADHGRARLAQKLMEDVEKRLLNVAVDTSTILDGYASCVESLRELDQSCAIMQRVCLVIKEYLKKRPDTVRKIITYITSEKRAQLSKHISNKRGTILDEEEFAGCNDEFLPEAMEQTRWKSWMPDPPDALPGQSSHVRQSADVFNMLISVYGSKELFVKEYRKLLAERLTSPSEKDVEFEERYIEVLKQRFSEGEMQQCEVMLKDIDESLEIDELASAKQGVPVSASIISSHFWPVPEQDEVSLLPDLLESGLANYEGVYRESRTRRKLNFMRSWGWVDVTLELGGISVNKIISNANAAVLYAFLQQGQWTVSELATHLNISKTVARRRLDWWTSQGLLSEELPPGATDETWVLVESAAEVEKTRQEDESEDEDQAEIEDAADAIEQLEMYWMYTRNYISQNEKVKAERIHKLFRMFFDAAGPVPTLETVSEFLFRKVQQNLLAFQNGHFTVVKESASTSNA